jgi:hypothetical protein
MQKTITPNETHAPARAWQRMLSGQGLELLDPSPFDIEIADIARATPGKNGLREGVHER